MVADGPPRADAQRGWRARWRTRFAALPEAQRFAFTTWGVLDRDSCAAARIRPGPSAFDDAGAKPMFWRSPTLVRALEPP